MKIKEQTRKRPEGCTWVRQGEAHVVWRDFRRVLAVDIASKLCPVAKASKLRKLEKALEDFNSLPLENIKVINTSFGKGYVGILSDGTKVVVRPGSTSNRGATLEFQLEQSKAFEGGSTYEIRYGD